MGSIFPVLASSVRSLQNCLRASSLPIWAGAIALLASPGTAPPPTWKPSRALSFSSMEPLTTSSNFSVSVSSLTFSNSLLMLSSSLRRPLVLRMPTIRCPVRTCDSPNISVPKTQPRSTASSTWEERSDMEVEPRGRRSRASVRSVTSRDGSMLNCLTMRCRSESCNCRIWCIQ